MIVLQRDHIELQGRQPDDCSDPDLVLGHRGDQHGPSTEHDHVVTQVGKQGRRLFHGRRLVVIELPANHDNRPSNAPSTRGGDAGTFCRTALLPNASATALLTAASAPPNPDSPAPFIPSGWKGLGVTRWPTRIGGRAREGGNR